MRRVLAFIILALGVSSLLFAQTQEWRLANFLDGKPDSSALLKISTVGDRTSIQSIVSDKLLGSAVFDPDGNLISFQRFGAGGQVMADVAMTDGHRLDVRANGREKTVSADNTVIVSDNASFWVFFLWLSRNPAFSQKPLSLYQDDGDRMVEMMLRNAGVESVTVGGRKARAYRLEMTVSDPIARFFWPHAYEYWFSADDFTFLAYQGAFSSGKIGRTERE